MRLFKRIKENTKVVIESVYTKDDRVYALCRKGDYTVEMDLCHVPKLCNTCPKAFEATRKLKHTLYDEMDRDWLELKEELKDEGYEVYREMVTETSKICKNCTLNKDGFEIKFRVNKEVYEEGIVEYVYINRETGEPVADWHELRY